MCWYKLVFKQKQPIHIGKFEWGVVSETEIFIPGWTMWGALVNAYIVKNKVKDKNQIQQIQKAFETITNFFPSFDGETILEPKYKDSEFIYTYKDKSGEIQIITEEEFRYKYVKADFKTAVEPISRKAKDEHLYEFEYIVPKFYWVGLIKLKDDGIKNFLETKPKVFIGGDTKYGYGLMSVERLKHIGDNELEYWNLGKDGSFKNKDNPLRSFLEFAHGTKFEGEVKLIPEMEFFQNTPLVKNVKFYINIGSLVMTTQKNYKLIKGKYCQC